MSAAVQVTVSSQLSQMQIAFVTDDDGISLVNADGTGRVSLARGFDQVSRPSWSPGGEELVLKAREGENYAGIYAMRNDGSYRRKLAGGVHPAASGPVWSPDGGRIAYETAPNWERGQVVAMTPDGSQPTNIGGPGEATYLPAYSPRGDMIAFFNSQQLFLSNDRDGSMIPLGDRVYRGDIHRPAWSPGGRQIAFVGADPETNMPGIYIINMDGTNQRVIFTDVREDGTVYYPGHPRWSPDGQRIAFEYGGEIREIHADGTNLRMLAAGRNPEWSQDGGHIAFASNRTGDWDIYVMNADGSNQVNVTNTPASNEIEPAWRLRWQ